eukprot:2638546-Amphidinium_carterae.1
MFRTVKLACETGWLRMAKPVIEIHPYCHIKSKRLTGKAASNTPSTSTSDMYRKLQGQFQCTKDSACPEQAKPAARCLPSCGQLRRCFA